MTKRLIDSAIWSNESFASLPKDARLLQLGMNNHADDQGRIKAHPAYLRSIVFPYDDETIPDVDAWLHMIEANGTIILYEYEGKQLAQFINWWKYQSLQYARPSRHMAPDGWSDRIRASAGQGNKQLTCNWTTPSGKIVPDTCDATGSLLSEFVPAIAPASPEDGETVVSVIAPGPITEPNLTEPNLTELNLTELKTMSRTEEEPNEADTTQTSQSSSFKTIVKAYESEIGLLTPLIGEEIHATIDEYPLEWITDAISIAAKSNKRNWRYVHGILRRCRAEGHPPKVGLTTESDGATKYDIPEEYADIIIG